MNTKLYYKKLSQLLNDKEQKTALLSSQNTIVLAGPGSGKTSVLTLKAAHILNNQVSPRGVACITYSREAALEMKQRLIDYGLNNDKRLYVGTIHNFCLSQILIPFAEAFRLLLPIPIKIASKQEIKTAFTTAKEKVSVSDNIKEIEMNVERRNMIGSLSSIKPRSYEIALNIALEYEKELHSKGVIDFEDIINFSVKLIQEQDFIKNALTAKYPWILVDEYQDLGKPLHEIILALLYNTSIKLFIVGDPDQSIYSFTGANPGFMQELINTKMFLEVQLKNNYRSPQDIVEASITVLGEPRRYTSVGNDFTAKFLFYECTNGWEEQFNYIAKIIVPKCEHDGIPREEIGILIKNHTEIIKCKQILEESGIPCYISNMNFERTDLINWLEKCAQWCVDSKSTSIMELFFEWCNKFNLNNIYNLQDVTAIVNFTKALNSLGSGLLVGWIDNLFKVFDIMNNVTIDEKENLKDFLYSIKSDEFKDYTVSMFCKIGKPIDQVVLLTWFAAKGLEFDVVVLTGMDEGVMPDYNAAKDSEKLLEQCRMCFVGVSRAKQQCFLLRSSQYTIYSKKYNKYYTRNYTASRFWNLLKEKFS